MSQFHFTLPVIILYLHILLLSGAPVAQEVERMSTNQKACAPECVCVCM